MTQPTPTGDSERPAAAPHEGPPGAGEAAEAPAGAAPPQGGAQDDEAAAPAGAPAGPAGEASYRTPEALLAERDQEVGVLKDRLLRLQAEFENFKKRQARERAEFLKFANESLLREVLPVLDNLDRAIASATDGADPGAIRTGIELIARLFRTTLEKAGVAPMESLGQPFDPTRMQAVAQVESPDVPDGQVVEEIQPGYLLEGRVLRPAMVKVARANRPAEAPDAGQPEA